MRKLLTEELVAPCDNIKDNQKERTDYHSFSMTTIQLFILIQYHIVITFPQSNQHFNIKYI